MLPIRKERKFFTHSNCIQTESNLSSTWYCLKSTDLHICAQHTNLLDLGTTPKSLSNKHIGHFYLCVDDMLTSISVSSPHSPITNTIQHGFNWLLHSQNHETRSSTLGLAVNFFMILDAPEHNPLRHRVHQLFQHPNQWPYHWRPKRKHQIFYATSSHSKGRHVTRLPFHKQSCMYSF